jgi:hypothetical protein
MKGPIVWKARMYFINLSQTNISVSAITVSCHFDIPGAFDGSKQYVMANTFVTIDAITKKLTNQSNKFHKSVKYGSYAFLTASISVYIKLVSSGQRG